MRRIRVPATNIRLGSSFEPELLVIEYVSTRRGDAERGPLVRMRPSEARLRLVTAGELVWVRGPRRRQIAILEIDDSIPEGKVALRDVPGVSLSESVTVVKPDLDWRPSPSRAV